MEAVIEESVELILLLWVSGDFLFIFYIVRPSVPADMFT